MVNWITRKYISCKTVLYVKWLKYHKFSSFFLKLFEKYKQTCIYVVCLLWRNPLQINFEKKKILYSNLFFFLQKKMERNLKIFLWTFWLTSLKRQKVLMFFLEFCFILNQFLLKAPENGYSMPHVIENLRFAFGNYC
jgi:hypothetical protein